MQALIYNRSSLQSLSSIIAQHLSSLSQHLGAHAELFDAMAVFPTAQFPGRAQEGLLGQLLRKKLEPDVEDWEEAGRRKARLTTTTTTTGGDGKNSGNDNNLDGASVHQHPFRPASREVGELWRWAGIAANEQARKHTWGGNYTLAEREGGVENVVTGLRRKLPDDEADDEDEEDEDEDEDGEEEQGKQRDEDDNDVAIVDAPVDDEMEIVAVHRKSTGAAGIEFDMKRDDRPVAFAGPAMSLNDQFRFLAMGQLTSTR